MVDEFSAFARMPQPVMEAGRFMIWWRVKLSFLSPKSSKFRWKLIMVKGLCDHLRSWVVASGGNKLLQNAQESLLEHHVKSPHIRLMLQETDEDTILTLMIMGRIS